MTSGDELWQTDEGLFLLRGGRAFDLGEDACDWITSLRADKRIPMGSITSGIDAEIVKRRRGSRRFK